VEREGRERGAWIGTVIYNSYTSTYTYINFVCTHYTFYHELETISETYCADRYCR
jgi:hypothetical protein